MTKSKTGKISNKYINNKNPMVFVNYKVLSPPFSFFLSPQSVCSDATVEHVNTQAAEVMWNLRK